MENILKKRSWSPFAAGSGLGLLMVFSILVLKKWIGASGAMTNLVAFCEHLILSGHARVSAFFIEEIGTDALIGFRVLLVVGIIFGAYISAKLSGEFAVSRVPDLWASRFGSSFAKRAAVAFVGGVCVMLGAPLADGCTLSRGIFSGALLDLSGWVFMGATFATAIALSFALYGKH